MSIRNRDSGGTFAASSKHPTQFARRTSTPSEVTLQRTSTLGQTISTRTIKGEPYEIVDTTGTGTYSVFRHAQEVAEFSMPFLGNQDELWTVAERAFADQQMS